MTLKCLVCGNVTKHKENDVAICKQCIVFYEQNKNYYDCIAKLKKEFRFTTENILNEWKLFLNDFNDIQLQCLIDILDSEEWKKTRQWIEENKKFNATKTKRKYMRTVLKNKVDEKIKRYKAPQDVVIMPDDFEMEIVVKRTVIKKKRDISRFLN